MMTLVKKSILIIDLFHFLEELGAFSFPTGFVNGVEVEELEDVVFKFGETIRSIIVVDFDGNLVFVEHTFQCY